MALGWAASASGQTVSGPLNPPPNGMREGESSFHALVNATVHVSPTRTIEHATVVIRDGRIVSVAGGVDPDGPGGQEPVAPAAPFGARAWDCKGLHVYAGFIDPWVEVDVSTGPAGTPGLHWNPLITPQRDALAGAGVATDVADQLRRLGFTSAGIAPRGGIIRGRAGVVSLAPAAGDPSRARPTTYASDTFFVLGFDTVGFGGGGAAGVSYPDSGIGSVALLRQSFIDAAWQRDARAAGATIPRNVLDELTDRGGLRLAFDAGSELDALRATYLAEEFGRRGVWIASGLEVRMLRAVVGAGWPIILPLNFPETPDVSSVGRIDGVSLTELMTWEQVPTGPRRFDEAGMSVSLTTARLRRRDQFDDNLRVAIKNGLPEVRALAMLTTNPAELLGVGDRLGTVEAGKAASLVVASGPIFDEGTQVRDVWIDGVRVEVNAAPEPRLEGKWDITIMPGGGGEDVPGVLVFESGRRVTLTCGDQTFKGRNARLAGGQVSFLLDSGLPEHPGEVVVSAVIVGEGRMVGQAIHPDGSVAQFTAARRAPDADPSGVWSLTLSGGGTVTYTIRGGRVVYEGDAGRNNTVRDFKVDGQVLSFSVETRTPAPEGEGAGRGPSTQDDEGGEGAGQRPAAPEGESGERAGQGPATPDAEGGERGGRGGRASAPGTTTTTRVRATIEGDAMSGTVTTQDGVEIAFTGTRAPLPAEEEKPDERPAVPEQFGYPFGPYARQEPPAEETVIIRGATIWTSAEAGIIQNGSMMVSGGKILYVGDDAGLSDLLSRIRLASPPREIDATGRHVTAGIIDCHSHTGLTSVNEGGQGVTAEVRISDAADPRSISWYRQLAGGVTCVNNLHGSANAIGGQNQVSKPRWGTVMPWDYFFEGAPLGIKFALGENPKSGNSYGQGAGVQYPQTRMGVEALIRDSFTAARQYAEAWERFARAGGVPPRRDLELEAVAQILSGERLVHCHAYRADEILMLCNMAREFGFRIGTFQHALEVYKVAPEVREAAIGASAFSDWWAFKQEVQDAIPSAGAIMHEVGIVVSFNSDSDELARRLNLEAAKAVRYGGLDPGEAFKFVTINPAIQLGIDERVGSLEAGKDADFVIWTGSPISTMSRPEQTWIEGRCYFSLEDDARLRAVNEAERQRIIQKVLALTRESGGREAGGAGGAGGGSGGRPAGRPGVMGLAQSVAQDAVSAHVLDLIRRGIDPAEHVCGDCGMTWQQWMRR